MQRKIPCTMQGRRKQFYIGQAKYKQHVRHLNAKVALEHASQENCDSLRKIDAMRLQLKLSD